ncbi:uncharacterized protein [Musca autumnalis]|uniref:uncharacterized protein n=1 Tax=Musca autumnalis TaxID=221902 RepID=UPI003CE863A2
MLLQITLRSLILILWVWGCRGSPVLSDKDTAAVQRHTKAEELLKYMNKSVDPCEDFYEYVCGNYPKYNPATVERPTTHFLLTVKNKLDEKLKTILESEDDQDTDADRKVKRFYHSCLHATELKETYPIKLREIIKEFGEMPLLVGDDRWQEAEFDWLETVAKIKHKYGMNILLRYAFFVDFFDKTLNSIVIGPPEFDLKKELYVDPKWEKDVEILIRRNSRRLLEFFGIQDKAVAVATAREFLQLEKSLAKAKISENSFVSLNETYVLLSLDETQEKYAPQFDVKLFFKLAVGDIAMNYKIYAEDEYLVNMLEVIKSTPKRIVANYIFYTLARAFITKMSESPDVMADICLARMRKYFHKNIDNMVYRRYNRPDNEQGIQDMWSHIRATLRRQLETSQLDWLSEETRQYALEKLHNINFEIVSYKDVNFTEILGPAECDSQDYLGNLQQILSLQAANERKDIGEDKSKMDYGEDLTVTPLYIYNENSLKMPVFYVQSSDAWSAAFPTAFNFGALGATIAHELLHGFDGHGRDYDVQGNYLKWWDANSDGQFKKRSQCFIDQYKEFIFAGEPLPEKPNQDENIADNGSVRLAYSAYMNWYNNTNDVAARNLETFPGMDFNHRQLFFIGFANLWCADNHRSTYPFVVIDTHAPEKFRIIGPLSNFEEFSKAFNCPIGSAMNPANKCKIFCNFISCWKDSFKHTPFLSVMLLQITFRCLILILWVSDCRGSPVLSDKDAAAVQRHTKAEELLKYMNKSVDPCEDFYEYVCGNYPKYNPATVERPTTNLLITMQIKLDEKLRTILESEDDQDTDADRKVKRFYHSCLHATDLKESYPAKLREIIKEFGEMPLLVGDDQWQEAEFDWLEMVAKINHKYGVNILLAYEFYEDFLNNTVNRFHIGPPDFDAAKEIYVDSKWDKDVRFLIKRNARWLLEFFGIQDKSVAAATAKEFFKLEKSLAKARISESSFESLNQTDVLRSLDETQEKYAPQLDVKHFLKLAVGDTAMNYKIYADDEYLVHMLEVIKTTPKRIVANYIFYNLARAFITEMSESREVMADICLARMRKYFHKNIDNMVYRRYNRPNNEQGIQDMWSHIRATLRRQLETSQLHWLSEETRQYALEKLQKINLEIVSYKDVNFTEILGSAEFDSQDYLGNLQKILSLQAANERNGIEEDKSKMDYGEELTVTPLYIYNENSLKMPVFYVQSSDAWSAAFPTAFNFGALGATIAHELLHGFDGHGRDYDVQGNYLKWWDTNSDGQFKKRSQCFIDQYKEFIFAGEPLPEKSNQDENIADNGGVRLAYSAYQNWYNNTNDVAARNLETFPGMDFTDRQLYFIGFANLWCSDIHRSAYPSVVIDIHAPEKFRTIGPLSNFEEFSKAFNCPIGSAMNPAKKCKIY